MIIGLADTVSLLGSPTAHAAVESIIVLGIFIREWRTSVREKRRHVTVQQAVENIVKPLGVQVDTLSKTVARLEAFIVGPDGENGIRGDLREVKTRVIGLEDRERDRLSRGGMP